MTCEFDQSESSAQLVVTFTPDLRAQAEVLMAVLYTPKTEKEAAELVSALDRILWMEDPQLMLLGGGEAAVLSTSRVSTPRANTPKLHVRV